MSVGVSCNFMDTVMYYYFILWQMLCHTFLDMLHALAGGIAIFCVVDVVTTRQMVQPVVEQGGR